MKPTQILIIKIYMIIINIWSFDRYFFLKYFSKRYLYPFIYIKLKILNKYTRIL